jgi:hypothetical protein
MKRACIPLRASRPPSTARGFFFSARRMEQMEQMEQILPKNSQNTRLKGTFPELPFHLFHLFHHHSRPTDRGVVQPHGNWATCGKRKQGQIVLVLQREPKCAPRFALSPEKGDNLSPFFAPRSLYIVRYDGNRIDSG